MKLRVYYTDHAGGVRTTDMEVPDEDLDQHLEGLGRSMASGGLFVAKEAGRFAFAVPASRVLEVERFPWS